MEKDIIRTIKYFALFDYPPTEDEIYCFLRNSASFDRFNAILKKKVKKRVITTQKSNRYTVGEYRIKISNIKYQISKNSNAAMKQCNNFIKRFNNSQKKLRSWRFRLYIKLLSLFPQIKLVGLSGSMAMMNAGLDDDIDLFIITAKNRLFTARFIAVVISYLLGVKRKRVDAKVKIPVLSQSPGFPAEGEGEADEKHGIEPSQNKICLNLFFDKSDLAVPSFKRSEFVAHEVLQMKPIINKTQTYEKFLQANSWVGKIFPNSIINKLRITDYGLIRNSQFAIGQLINNWLEQSLKSFQLNLINRHKTTEIITAKQLWFHPDDFSRKLPLNLRRKR